jgi:hypothetical protein
VKTLLKNGLDTSKVRIASVLTASRHVVDAEGKLESHQHPKHIVFKRCIQASGVNI